MRVSSSVKKLGINTADKTRPYLFQLLEKFETATQKEDSENKLKEKSVKGTAQLVTNKQSPKLNTDENLNSLRSQKKRSEKLKTDERAPTEEMFNSESLGLDMTIDSEAINQFDYNESVIKED